jgi:hypothetical protein
VAFLFRLEKRRRDARRSTNAQSAVPDWRPGDTIHWAEEPSAWLAFETTMPT